MQNSWKMVKNNFFFSLCVGPPCIKSTTNYFQYIVISLIILYRHIPFNQKKKINLDLVFAILILVNANNNSLYAIKTNCEFLIIMKRIIRCRLFLYKLNVKFIWSFFFTLLTLLMPTRYTTIRQVPFEKSLSFIPPSCFIQFFTLNMEKVS